MHILMYKLKYSLVGRLIAVLLVFALIVPLITHYYLGKHIAPSEHFRSRSKLDKQFGMTDTLLDNIDELKFQVDELKRIKLSLANELRELEGRKSKLLTDISTFTKKADGLRSQAEHHHSDVLRAQRELELIKLAKQRANDCPQLPHLKLPQEIFVSSLSKINPLPDKRTSSNCDLNNCFDFSRCPFNSGFPVFVYDFPLGRQRYDSTMEVVWELLKGIPNYTVEPERACLYVVIVGSLEDIVDKKKNSELELDLHSLPYWRGDGRNHLILHAPLSRQAKHTSSLLTLNINTGLALMAQTTFSSSSRYRHGFDIVVPPFTGPTKGELWNFAPFQLPAQRKHLLSFQAEHAATLPEGMAVLRNQLNMLAQEANDFFIELYLSKSDFSSSSDGSEWLLWGQLENRTKVLRHSTFTLILDCDSPSWDSTHIRLAEALQFGAIPVILLRKVILPFNDMIDWHKAAIILAPARLSELNVLLRTITNEDILELRRQGRFLWQTYLSTTDVLLKTVLATVRTRLALPAQPVAASPTPSLFSESRPPATNSLDPEAAIGFPQQSPTFLRNLTVTVVDTNLVWNSPPGAFQMYPSSPFDPIPPSSSPLKNSSKGFELIGNGLGGAGVEFNKALGGNYPMEQFTVVILTYQREIVLMESIQRLVGLQYLNKVVVVWNSPDPPSLSLRWPDVGVPLHVVKVAKNSLNNRFVPYDVIETDAIFAVDDDVEMRHEEILLAFRVWRDNKDRIVGFPGRFHAWDSQNNQWLYSSEYSCELSMILTGAAFYHKYYSYLYTHWMPQVIRDRVDEYMNCEDIAMNFLVSHITRKPPIKVTSRWTFTCPNCPINLWEDKTHFEERSKCINFFVEVYGYMPLLRTQFRADSVLFKTRLPSDKSKCFKYV